MFSSARSTFSGLEMESAFFRNKKTGHEINIIGVVHLAHESFWTAIQTTLNEASENGIVIHLEGVRPFVGPLSEADMERVDTLRKMAGFSKFMAEKTGLTYQRDGLQLDKLNAVYHDSDVLTVARKLSEESFKKMKKSVDSFDNWEEEFKDVNIGKFMVFLLKNMGWVLAGSKLFKRLGLAAQGLDSDAAILDYRNELAITAALQEDKPVTLLWGAAHIPGMRKLLEEAGYTRLKNSWRVAIPSSYKLP